MAQYEVAVIGGGPAGAAAAIDLARAGHQVALLEKQGAPTFKVGEGLPPAAGPLLDELGALDRLRAGPHLLSYGHESAWGSHMLHRTDFIRNPYGHGWRLDRASFDAMLRDVARDAGACVCEATCAIATERIDTHSWRLTLAGPGGMSAIEAAWLLDCTGRPSWLARSRGVRRRHDDRLRATVALYHTADADDDTLTLVESTPHGWWYTALLPTRQRIVVYLADADAASSQASRTPAGYRQLLQQTGHIRARLAAHNYQIDRGPWLTAANSARLERVVGDGWLAAGDAAFSFDPLSSQGILTALYSGLMASRALHALLAGDGEALGWYASHLDGVYDAYLSNRTAFYSYERRWPASEFWSRRITSGM